MLSNLTNPRYRIHTATNTQLKLRSHRSRKSGNEQRNAQSRRPLTAPCDGTPASAGHPGAIASNWSARPQRTERIFRRQNGTMSARLGPGQIGSVSTRSDREATAPKPWSIERLSRSDATSANFVYTLSIAIIYIIQDLMQSCRTLAMSSRIVRVRAHHHQIGVNVEIAIYLRYFAVSPAGRVLSARASGTTSPSGGAGAWVEASGWR